MKNLFNKLELKFQESLVDENVSDTLKQFFYNKYIIKKVPASYINFDKKYVREFQRHEDESVWFGVSKYSLKPEDEAIVLKLIQNDQKESLDKWLLFLSDEKYPMWFKFYIFNGITKVGKYFENLRTFSKRSSSTTDKFMDVNEDIIDNIYNYVNTIIENNGVLDNGGSFKTMNLDFKNLYSCFYDEKRNSNIKK